MGLALLGQIFRLTPVAVTIGESFGSPHAHKALIDGCDDSLRAIRVLDRYPPSPFSERSRTLPLCLGAEPAARSPRRAVPGALVTPYAWRRTGAHNRWLRRFAAVMCWHAVTLLALTVPAAKISGMLSRMHVIGTPLVPWRPMAARIRCLTVVSIHQACCYSACVEND